MLQHSACLKCCLLSSMRKRSAQTRRFMIPKFKRSTAADTQHVTVFRLCAGILCLHSHQRKDTCRFQRICSLSGTFRTIGKHKIHFTSPGTRRTHQRKQRRTGHVAACKGHPYLAATKPHRSDVIYKRRPKRRKVSVLAKVQEKLCFIVCFIPVYFLCPQHRIHAVRSAQRRIFIIDQIDADFCSTRKTLLIKSGNIKSGIAHIRPYHQGISFPCNAADHCAAGQHADLVTKRFRLLADCIADRAALPVQTCAGIPLPQGLIKFTQGSHPPFLMLAVQAGTPLQYHVCRPPGSLNLHNAQERSGRSLRRRLRPR